MSTSYVKAPGATAWEATSLPLVLDRPSTREFLWQGPIPTHTWARRTQIAIASTLRVIPPFGGRSRSHEGTGLHEKVGHDDASLTCRVTYTASTSSSFCRSIGLER